MTASLLPADDTPGAPGVAPEVSTAPRLPKYYQVKRQLLELTAALEKHFAKKIEATVNVDPELIGGARITVGDTVIDASVEAQLQAMATRLRA